MHDFRTSAPSKENSFDNFKDFYKLTFLTNFDSKIILTGGVMNQTFKVDTKRKFLFSHMKVHEKTRTNAVDRFLISYLVLEISTFKGPKHDTQNWFTANNSNGENYDVIRFAC